MKKLISIILSLIMLVSVGVSAAELQFSDEEAVLYDLGILKEIKADKNSVVTRGEFTEMLVKILNATGSVDVTFSDINIYHDYYNVMALGRQYGLLSSDIARPDDAIKYNEAVKMLVCMLGYGEYAANMGGYPTGYLKAAQMADVTKGITVYADANLVYKDAVSLIYNSITADIMEPISIGETVDYQVKYGTNILEQTQNTKRAEGLMYAAGGKTIYSNLDLDDNEVVIDGVQYITSMADIAQYVGMNIEFYYRENSKEIIAIAPSDTDVIKLDAEDVYAFEDGKLYYEGENQKEEDEKISLSAIVVYNDLPVEDFDKSLYLDKQGEITLIDNDGDKAADIVFLDITEDYVVKIADNYSGIVYDLYDTSRNVCLSEDKAANDLTFTDELGNVMFVGELMRHDVISVRKSLDGSKVSAVFSISEAKGTITAIENDGDKKYVTVDGVTYGTTDAFNKNEDIKIGDWGVFGLTTRGKIATINRNFSAEGMSELGYLIATARESGLDSSCKYRVLTKDGVKIFTSSDKIKLDGESVSDDTAYDTITANYTSQIIRFTVNSEGVLREIDTIDGGQKDTLKHMYSADELEWRKTTGIFGSKIPTSAKTMVFKVPEEISGDDEDYTVRDISYFIGNDKYSFEAYKCTDDSHFADAIVIKGTGSDEISAETGVSVVKSMTQAVDEDGQALTKLIVLDKGVEKGFFVKDDSVLQAVKSLSDSTQVHTLAEGDVIRYVTDDRGKINAIELYYDRAGDTFKYGAANGYYNVAAPNNQFRISYNEIYSLYSGNMYVAKGSIEGEGTVLGLDKLECYPANRYTIVVYDSAARQNKLYLGKVSDLIDYKTAGKGSKIVLYTNYTQVGTIIVYK